VTAATNIAATACHKIEGAKVVVINRFENINLPATWPTTVVPIAIFVLWKQPYGRPNEVAFWYLGFEDVKAILERLFAHKSSRVEAVTAFAGRANV